MRTSRADTPGRTSRIVGQAYPWDLTDDPSRAAAWGDLGLDTLAVPLTYHAVRAISWQPDSSPRIFQSARSGELPGYREAAHAAHAAGLAMIPWLVLAHNDGIEPDPESAVRDAWGNPSWTGACPSSRAVREVHAARVAATVAEFGPDDVLVENVTPPGFDHPWPHDKAAISRIDVRLATLLTLCYCSACAAALAEADRDPERDAASVRAAFRDGGDAEDEVQAWLSVRETMACAFVRELSLAAGPARLSVAATRARRSFGPRAPLGRAPAGVVALAHLDQPEGLDDARAWRAAGDRTAGMLHLDGDLHPEKITAVDDLYLYHIGMTPPALLPGLLDRVRSSAPKE